MKTSLVRVLLCLALPVFATARAQANPDVEKGVRALAAEFVRNWKARDINAVMACHAEPEGLLIWGGTSHTLASMKARIVELWNDRTSESWQQDKVDVIVLGPNTALLQITWSGRYTLRSGAIWEFKSSSFDTCLVKKFGDRWKIVAGQNSGRGTQVNAAKKQQ